MSHTTVLAVAPDRRPASIAVFRNAFGWSASIWSRLHLVHHPEVTSRHAWISDEISMVRLWRNVEDLPAWQQVPLVLTFDTGVIPAQEFEWAADQLEEFEQRLPEPPERANHVPAMIELLRSRPETPFIGMWGTSVAENCFDPWDEENDCPGSGISMEQMYLLERHRQYA